MSAVSQPSGTVTLVFTDIEGSTRLLEELGTEAYREALAEHRRIVRDACGRFSGYEVDYEGDAFFYAFASATDAVSAISEAMAGLADGPIWIRVGIHTGEPALDPPKYVGLDVHRAARVMSSAHGGQVVLSPSTVALLEPGSFALKELGQHRLKDLSQPIPLHQLLIAGLPDEFPRLKTLYHSTLPVPATPFLGREAELAEVASLLAREDARLVTLTGPGGTGKTRLALQAAAEASDGFPDGVYWVPLAPLRDPKLLATTLAQALELQEQPGVAIVETMVRSLASRRPLLVVDNCEHLADAAAVLLRQLLEGCPALVVAASSRERLGLRSERVYPVPPMAAADGELLFTERALAVARDFTPDEHVAAICEAVDGLPLAIELAAARVRSLSTQAIREHLSERLSLLTSRDRDLEERQRTLEATIAWSYDLLDGEEQRVLRALSVFAGGCTLAAAEAIAGADLDVLESLLDKSLLRHRVDEAGQDRYWMLETIREYAARELWRVDDVEALRGAHVTWVLEMVREVAPRWGDPAPPERLARIHADEGNVRIALSRAIERREANLGLEIVGLVGRTLMEAGRLVEVRTWAQEALALGGDPALEGMALLTLGMSDWSAGSGTFEAAVERLGSAGLAREAAYATMALGVSEAEAGSVDRGLDLLEAARAEFERLGNDYGAEVTRVNINYAQSLRWPLEPSEAARLASGFRVGAALARARGEFGDEVSELENLTHMLVDAGEPEEAWSAALEPIALMRDGRAGRRVLPFMAIALARVARLRGDAERSLLLAAAARATASELGITMPVARGLALEEVEAAARNELDGERAARATAAGEAMTVESLLEYLAGLE